MMASWRSGFARLLTPDRKKVLLAERGFPVKDEASRHRLESVGLSFLDGFQRALESGDAVGTAFQLDTVGRAYRGFAYEGAAMAFAVRPGPRSTTGSASPIWPGSLPCD